MNSTQFLATSMHYVHAILHYSIDKSVAEYRPIDINAHIPLPIFFCCLNNCCRLFWTLYNFALPFYLRCHFSSPNFRLPNFLLPIFPVAVFSVVFSVFVISDNNFVLPFFPTISIFVAEFSRCPIFCCRYCTH